MNQDGMYYKVTQEYLHLNREKEELMRERDNISVKLKLIEDILIDLNDILCKHGNHIYEHFEESEPQESEKINCKATKCENCTNHNYYDFEPQERSE